MTEEERGALSSSPRTAGPPTPTAALMEERTKHHSSHSPRRPAEKRAVPAEFDVTSFAQGQGVATAADVDATPESQRSKSFKTIPAAAPISKLAAKRPKRSNINEQQSCHSTFDMKANQPSFPLVLMGVMSAPQNEEFISFLSYKKSLIIIHPGALAKQVLTKSLMMKCRRLTSSCIC